MNTPPNAIPVSPVESPAFATASAAAIRPLYWSVRRELWEHRSIYIAPLAAAGLCLFGFVISLTTLPRRMHALLALDPQQQASKIVEPYNFTAILIMLTAIVVGVFYCLDAMHGERRDRSILFWKSLPVSDRTTILAKVTVPLVVLPAIVFATVVALQFVMLILSSVVLLPGGTTFALWRQLPFVQMELVLLYGLIVHALWQAPLYSWLLLVSAWARRATFLWAASPLVVLAAIDKMVFHTAHFGALLNYPVFGGCSHAFDLHAQGDPYLLGLHMLTPGKFLATPGLYLGLAIAAGFLAATVRLRRNREPM